MLSAFCFVLFGCSSASCAWREEKPVEIVECEIRIAIFIPFLDSEELTEHYRRDSKLRAALVRIDASREDAEVVEELKRGRVVFGPRKHVDCSIALVPSQPEKTHQKRRASS